jgi:hypothetical protein
VGRGAKMHRSTGMRTVQTAAQALLDLGVGVEAGLWHEDAVAAWNRSPFRDFGKSAVDGCGVLGAHAFPDLALAASPPATFEVSQPVTTRPSPSPERGSGPA